MARRDVCGKDSQIEDKVVMSLLGDAVMEPDCGQDQSDWLHGVHCSPPLCPYWIPGTTTSTLSP